MGEQLHQEECRLKEEQKKGDILPRQRVWFLLDSTSVLSINKLTPCVPRFYDKFVGKTDFALFIPDWLQVIEVNLSESLIMGGMITPNPFSFLYSLYSRLGFRSIGIQANHER